MLRGTVASLSPYLYSLPPLFCPRVAPLVTPIAHIAPDALHYPHTRADFARPYVPSCSLRSLTVFASADINTSSTTFASAGQLYVAPSASVGATPPLRWSCLSL